MKHRKLIAPALVVAVMLLWFVRSSYAQVVSPAIELGATAVAEAAPVDTDGDGLPDSWEARYQLDPLSPESANGATGDPDGDSLSNIDEYYNGTSPVNADSDGDGLSDQWEVENGLDPTDSTGLYGAAGDFDGDGLSNGAEKDYGVDPANSDTNADGVSDPYEVGDKQLPAEPGMEHSEEHGAEQSQDRIYLPLIRP